ncbi:conserved hypothetical protein, putative exported protein [Herminiimonas arsenicoxydans]|uniref:Exported signal peptide protein n=1 Tax=Herminiimonas arsenicoxydans TaxID=204773 RepID=A4G601_HERAR|nr:conserved hypothetical protein, putative exported protein [Herminiimonas arsenicoxydans]
MKKLLYAVLLIGVSSALSPAFAEGNITIAKNEATKKPLKKTVKKAAPAAATAAAATASAAVEDDDEDLGEANIEGSIVNNFNCELGNKITTYYNASDDKHLAIRWKDKVHRMRRIGTSTGANRFENRKVGLVWIHIPSKAMLLDSGKGLQLANECRDPEQAKAFAAKTKN